MTSPSLAYGLMFAQQQTERMACNINQELERLGCADTIYVARDDLRLCVVRGAAELYPEDPAVLLATLRQTSPPVQPDELWATLIRPADPADDPTSRPLATMGTIVLLLAGLSIVLFCLK